MDRFLGTGRRSIRHVSLVDLLGIARLLDALPQQRALLAIQPQTIDRGEQLTLAVSERA